MTLKSWKAEFYTELPTETTDPVEHSLKKWTGLLPQNLKKHGVELLRDPGHTNSYIYAHHIFDAGTDEHFDIDSSTCSLCAQYDCSDCPLSETRGGWSCDEEIEYGEDEETSPWDAFRTSLDPHPMVYWLTRTKDNL